MRETVDNAWTGRYVDDPPEDAGRLIGRLRLEQAKHAIAHGLGLLDLRELSELGDELEILHGL
jgi:hypothetical protein